jgi:hypothetical protein
VVRRAGVTLLGNSVAIESPADHDGLMTVTSRVDAATALIRLAQSDAYGDRADAFIRSTAVIRIFRRGARQHG